MRQAILHIGMPRTGTTTLQRVLHDRRAALGAQGVLYPDLTPASANSPHLSHQHLGETLDGRRPARERDELLDRLAGQIERSDATIVLLSYEGLVLAPAWRQVPRKLAAFFARHGLPVTLVVTVKPQAEYINSMYTWRVQFLREARPFAAYLEAALRSPKLRYDRLIAPWRGMAHHVLGVPLHDATDQRPLLARFAQELGLTERLAGLLAPGDHQLVENRSPGPLAIEAARGLAHARLRHADARDVTRFIEARAAELVSFQGVDPVARARIEARFAAANDAFARRVWSTPWSARVSPARAGPVNALDGAMSAPDRAAVIALRAAAAAACGVHPASGVRRILLGCYDTVTGVA